MRKVKWINCFWAAGLAGCSLYPIPDDVISISTEEIVRHARCEIRSEILSYIVDRGFVAPASTEDEIIAFVKRIEAKNKKKQKLNDIENYMLTLMGVASVYTFDFNITENNKASGDASFTLPFTPPKVLNADASGSLNLTRVGQRNFSTGDHWDDLITNSGRCRGVGPRHGNIIHPLDGSIGVGRVVRTFIDISDQGGAKDSFVDTLIFTTQISGDANASIKLAAVPHSFRLLSASADLSASRIDIHKMVVSLVFPHAPAPAAPGAPGAITGVKLAVGYLDAPFQRPPEWRARYNLCVADARQREDAFKALRFEAPEVYCITYADAFAPKTGEETRQAGSQEVELRLPSPPGGAPPPPPPPPPASRVPSVRPNRQ